MENDPQIAIIGAGPIGLELAIALKQMEIPYLHFDKGQVAQMIYNFPPQTSFFSSSERISLAGIPIQTTNQQKCSREAYLAYLRSLALSFDLKVNSYEEITDIVKTAEGFDLTTSSAKGQQKYHCRYLVLATGGTSHPNLLHVPGENLPHVSVKMDDPHKYFKKKVVVIGGKNSTAETSLRCSHAGAEVTIVSRSKQFDTDAIKSWLLPELSARIEKGQIKCFFQSHVQEIFPNEVLVKSLDNNPIKIPTDFVIKTIGFKCDTTLLSKCGADFNRETDQPFFNEETMEASVPGLFVIGTLTAGTQNKRYRIFIENTHIHVEKVVHTLSTRLNIPESKIPKFLARTYKPTNKVEE